MLEQGMRIRLIFILTADIDWTNSLLDLGCFMIRSEPVFLSHLQLIILPLAYRKTEDKRKQIEMSVELARKITDERQQTFALSGLLVFCDKVIDKELTERMLAYCPASFPVFRVFS